LKLFELTVKGFDPVVAGLKLFYVTVNGLDEATGAVKAFGVGATKGLAAKALGASPGFTNGLADAAPKPVDPPAFKKGLVAAASGFLFAMNGLVVTSGAFITGGASFFGSSFGLEVMKLIEEPPEAGLLSFGDGCLNSNLI